MNNQKSSNHTTNKIIRARGYVRVSLVGKDRKDTLQSDAMQIDEARRYADYLGFSFDEEASKLHADLDVSGFRKAWRTRPGLMAHYEAAKRGEFDVLVFFKISRLARNVREALDMIAAFEKVGVSFHFVAERIDSTSAQGRFLRNVLLSAAEMQYEDISEFLKSTVARRAREGRLQGTPPIWIRKTGKERDGGVKYELIPDQVEAIHRMIELRLQGTGYVRIAKRLNEEGYRTVTGKFWREGNVFKYLQPTWIETMLGTGFYGRDTNEPLRIPGSLPAILTQEEADRLLAVQRLYSDDYGRKSVQGLDWMVNKRRKVGRRSADTIHLLSGILFCPICGARMIATSKDKRNRDNYFAYVCPNYITRADIHVKGLSSVNSSSMEDAVLRVLRAVLKMPDAPIETKPRKRTVNALEALQKKIDRLVNLHLDGKIEDGDFKRIYTELVVEKEALQTATGRDPSAELRAQAMELASKGQLTREELRQLVLIVVERVDAPITIEGVTIRSDRRTLRRLAKVKVKVPNLEGVDEYLSAIYHDEYGGRRTFIPVKEGQKPDLKMLIGDRRLKTVDEQANLPLNEDQS